MKPTAFDLHFRDNVVPNLRNLIQAEAVCVANGVEDWDGALRSVWEYAGQHGCTSCSAEAQDALDQLIMVRLSDEIAVAEAGTHNRQSTVWNWILRGASAGSQQ
jgi:hypothetical protein